MISGTFANNSEIQYIPKNVEVIDIDDQKVYILGKVTGDIVSSISDTVRSVSGIRTIGAGIGETVGGVLASTTGMGALAGVPVMVVSGSAIAAGSVELAQGVGVVYSSLGNLGKDLKEFVENRPPRDSETILSDGTFKRTNIIVQRATVYEKDGKYYHRDQLHRGKASHLEVYDKRGNHLGEADIHTAQIKPGTSDPIKKLPK